MNEQPPKERSIWSSKFDEMPDKIRDRIANAPPIPEVKRTRTQAVLTALPVLMLMVGLGFYWYGERQQRSASPILAEQQSLVGGFDRITPRKDKGPGKNFYWLNVGERTRPIRISYEQRIQLLAKAVSPGTAVQLRVAPTVEGSNVLWLVEEVVVVE